MIGEPSPDEFRSSPAAFRRCAPQNPLDGAAKRRPYHTMPHKMGVKMGTNLNNIQKLLAKVEMEKFR